jgi:hypothetical protein
MAGIRPTTGQPLVQVSSNTLSVLCQSQGILSIRPGQCPDPRATLTRLWIHENLRVFHDR